MKYFIILFSLFFVGCGVTDNLFVRTTNLNEEELMLTEQVIEELGNESGLCQVTLDDSGENTLTIVDTAEHGTLGWCSWRGSEYYHSLTKTDIYVLDISNREDWQTKFKCIVKHEFVHFCSHNLHHIEEGNLMNSTFETQSVDCKLTSADLDYISK